MCKQQLCCRMIRNQVVAIASGSRLVFDFSWRNGCNHRQIFCFVSRVVLPWVCFSPRVRVCMCVGGVCIVPGVS